jgi:methionyl-tRNA synthetase
MTASRFYVTTAIPYVNARPHLGFALELVQADVLARHHRQCGDAVRFLTGTDDNSLKNVLAAEAEGRPTQELVDRNATAFEALREPLGLSFDDFIRTSRDPRHRPGVERFWRACAAAGDLYRKHYEGLYCVGCEQFYVPAELRDGRCPEHGDPPQLVAEENWFFRLSRYQSRLHDLIASERLRIEPAARRNEVLRFIEAGLEDFSISRSRTRAHGWGIPVPDDPGQVIYVWWDALGNYITALGYGGAGEDYRRWWVGGDRRVHLIGKGVLRFHAVYWPAMLLSAGESVPTDILVHDYLTIDGQKISKSAGRAVDPVELAGRFGTDALRWWLLREVPRVGDADFTVHKLVARANTDLANDLGNLVTRVVSMLHRYRAGEVPTAPAPATDGDRLATACHEAPDLVREALARYDVRRAIAAVWRIVEEANRYVEQVRPWELAKTERTGDARATRELDAALGVLVDACRVLAGQLAAFIPDTAGRITAQCEPVDGRLPAPQPLFRRLPADQGVFVEVRRAACRSPLGGVTSATWLTGSQIPGGRVRRMKPGPPGLCGSTCPSPMGCARKTWTGGRSPRRCCTPTATPWTSRCATAALSACGAARWTGSTRAALTRRISSAGRPTTAPTGCADRWCARAASWWRPIGKPRWAGSSPGRGSFWTGRGAGATSASTPAASSSWRSITPSP